MRKFLLIAVFVTVFISCMVGDEVAIASCGYCGLGRVSMKDSCGIVRVAECKYAPDSACRAEDCYPTPIRGSDTINTDECEEYRWVGCPPGPGPGIPPIATPVSTHLYSACEKICVRYKTKLCHWNFASDACGGAGTPDPSVCTGCDCTLPTCANANGGNANYTTAVTGPECLGQPATCTKKDSCGNTCGNPSTKQQACYHKETNFVNPAMPENIYLSIDNITYTLSKDPNNPTLVGYPFSSSSPTQIRATLVPKPSGSGEYGYRFYDNLANAYSDRFAVTSDANTALVNIAPAGHPVASSLTENVSRFVGANVYGRDLCGPNTLEDAPINQILKGYYRVNTLPNSNGIIETASSSSTKGCTIVGRYTGSEANTTLRVTVTGWDINGNNTINGAVFWLAKEGVSIEDTKKVTNLEGGIPLARSDKVGVFVDKDDRIFVANIDSSGTFTGWRPVQSDALGKYINDNEGKKIVSNITASKQADNIYNIDLTFPSDSVFSGTYRLHTAMTDNLSYRRISRPGVRGIIMVVDTRKTTTTNQTWTFDFIPPTVSNFTKSVPHQEQNNITLLWTLDGTGTDVRHVVFNVAETGSLVDVTRKYPTPESTITPSESLGADQIGILDPLVSGWSYYDYQLTSTTLNIQNKGNGQIIFYVSAYDQACNLGTLDTVASSNNSYDLNKWITIKGGMSYSQGSVSYRTKSTVDRHNLSSELFYSQSSSIRDMIPYEVLKYRGATATGVTSDTNFTPDMFNILKSKMEKKTAEGIATELIKPITSLTGCGTGEVCMYSSGEGFTIPKGIYRGKIIFVSDGDINIEPNITLGNSSDGIIVFSGGTINIVPNGVVSSLITLGADVVNAFLIARKGIAIPSDAANPSDPQDQIRINGGAVAFGQESTNPAFYLTRNLGLQNANTPVLILTYEPKYTDISKLFFGEDTSVYKREVGFKPG